MYAALLARQVVNQSEGISNVAPRKVRLILHDCAPILYEAGFGLFDAFDGYFEDWPERRITFDKQVNMLAVQADHPRCFTGDLEAELLHVKRCRALWVFRLN